MPDNPQSLFIRNFTPTPQGVVINLICPLFTIATPLTWAEYDEMVARLEEERKKLAGQIRAASPEDIAALRSQMRNLKH